MEKALKEIREKLKKNEKVLKKLHVRALFLFGLVLRKNIEKINDLDFLVDFEKKTFDDYMDLKFFLEDLFKIKVDLVINTAIKKSLKEIITKESVRVA